jgi:hypothetical protein
LICCAEQVPDEINFSRYRLCSSLKWTTYLGFIGISSSL